MPSGNTNTGGLVNFNSMAGWIGGNVPRRRKGGGFSPLSLSPYAWWDWSDTSTLFQDTAATTPAIAEDDPIGRVNDKSGNARNATQGTAGSRPTLKLAVQNGLSVGRFDGTADYLSAAAVAAMFDGEDRPYTVLAMASRTTVVGTQDLCSASTSAIAPYSVSEAVNATLRIRVRDNASSQKLVVSGNVLDTAVHTWGYVNTGTVGNVYLDGVLVTSGSTDTDVGTKTQTFFSIGALDRTGAVAPGEFWPGDIGELLVFDRALSAGDLALMQTYLKNKWGTP